MKAWIPLTVTAVVATGCGSGPATTASPSSTQPIASTTTASPVDATPSPAAGPVITVTIAAGSVTPTNAQAEAAAGQPIVLAVSSDVTDSIHVHAIPEHVFDVQSRPAAQRFEFTVDVPGSVDVELHDLNRTIVTIAVRP